MAEIKIEKGIPMPESKCLKGGGIRQRVLRQMEVGDSFAIDDVTLIPSMRLAAKSLGIKITIRRSEGGWRIWRVE